MGEGAPGTGKVRGGRLAGGHDRTLDGKHGEATPFGPMLLRIVTHLPWLFHYITGDAGLASAQNAELVVARKKVYAFGIKGNFKRLFPLPIWTA